MKRLVMSLIGCYILIAIGLSVSVSQIQNNSSRLDTWPTIKINLPFDKQTLEDASFDSLMAIGNLAIEYFANTFDTLGQIAMWSNEKLIATDQKLASLTHQAQRQSRSLTVNSSNRIAPSIFTSAKTTFLSTIVDTKQLLSDLAKNQTYDPKDQLQEFARSIENNFQAIAQVAPLVKNLATPPERVLGQTTAAETVSVTANKLLCAGTLYYDASSSGSRPLYYIDPGGCEK